MVLNNEERVEIVNFFNKNEPSDVKIIPNVDLNGFQGSYSTLIVKSETNESKWFIKSVPEGDDIVESFYGKSKIFVKEVKIYRDVFPEMAVLNQKLWPDCLLAREGRYLILEDMQQFGWRTAESMDTSHITIALQSYAKFHASSMISLQKPECLRLISSAATESMLSPDRDSPGRQMWDSFCKIANDVARVYLPEFECYDVYGVFQRAANVVNQSSKFQCCLNHGDPWMNNILFRYDQGNPTEAAFVDFQSARIAPPALDVSIFLHILRPGQVKYWATEIYYKCLVQTLHDHNTEVSLEEFSDSVRHYREASKCIAALYIFLTKLPEEYMSRILVDQKTFIRFALGHDYSPVWEALECDANYRQIFLQYLKNAVCPSMKLEDN